MSSAILRGIIDIQSEEITRLMTLVDHLTVCLEQCQNREKAALQRCSELEIAVNQVSATKLRADGSVLGSTASVCKDALDSMIESSERCETLVLLPCSLLRCVLHSNILLLRPPAVFLEVEELRKQIQEVQYYNVFSIDLMHVPTLPLRVFLRFASC